MLYKSTLTNGKFGVPWSFAKKNEGKEFYVEIHPVNKRSLGQNALFWLRNRILAAELGERQCDLLQHYTKESVADLVKAMAFGYQEVKIQGKTFEIPHPSATLPIGRFNDLLATQEILANYLDPPIILPS